VHETDMAFQTPITISKVLGSIERREYVLPAIQREFVWRPAQIECLFDSLMRRYPIGSFLFWMVGRESIEKYKFYDFMLDYHQRNNPHCQTVGAVTQAEITAILDGQQRLTALNIGLRGSYAYKLKYRWWNDPSAYPVRRLHVNLLGEAEENEYDMKYDFRFLTAEEAAQRDRTHCWYPVREVLKAVDAVDLHGFIVAQGLGAEKEPFRILAGLHHVVHTEPIVAYYTEEDQDLDKVLHVFIRTNSGGTKLSYSDMLMSMATAQWRTLDARAEIHDKVVELNDAGGFGLSQDFLLKAGLMLAGVSNVGFRVTNFTRANMERLEQHWDRITSAVSAAVALVASFGFSESSLRAHNAVLPIAHYLYRRELPTGFLYRATYKEDREAIRSWLTRSLLKRGIWGSGLDTLLTALRAVIDEHGAEVFPVERLEEAMRARGKSLSFEREELEDLVESRDRSFALLSLLYPFADTQNNKFHIDHVFPRARFWKQRLRRARVPMDAIPEYVDRVDRLPNLQLLVGDLNQSKSDMLPREWIETTFDGRAAQEYVERHDLGDVPDSITEFGAFYEARRDRLLDRLLRLRDARRAL